MEVPANTVGVMQLELMDCTSHLLGGGVPLPLLPNRLASDEARSLIQHSSLSLPSWLLDLACWLGAAASSASTAATTATTASAATFGSDALDLGSRLLEHALELRLPGCAVAVLDTLVDSFHLSPKSVLESCSPMDWAPFLSGQRSQQQRLSPLHLVMKSGSTALVEGIVTWALRRGARPNWSLSGPCGLSPLHLAALSRGRDDVVSALLLRAPAPVCSDSAASWLLCRDLDGFTPADLSRSYNPLPLSEALDRIAKQVLNRAAAATPTVTHSPGVTAEGSGSQECMDEGGSGIVSEAIDEDFTSLLTAGPRRSLVPPSDDQTPSDAALNQLPPSEVQPPPDQQPMVRQLEGSSVSGGDHDTVPSGGASIWRCLFFGFPGLGAERRYLAFQAAQNRSIDRSFCVFVLVLLVAFLVKVSDREARHMMPAAMTFVLASALPCIPSALSAPRSAALRVPAIVLCHLATSAVYVLWGLDLLQIPVSFRKALFSFSFFVTVGIIRPVANQVTNGNPSKRSGLRIELAFILTLPLPSLRHRPPTPCCPP